LKYITSEYFYLVDNKELIKYNNEQTKKLILTFINLFKCNGYNLNKFIKIVNKNNKDLLSIIVNIYLLYSEELKSTNSMDFNDLIIEATNYVKQYGIYHNYKYIIIDEYQDTSYIRYLFIKSIINKTKAKIMVVGDDWQSIYKFTGCDLNVFINFKKYFKKTKILYINNTYRNSKELINITGKFIMKNPKQMKKKLNSNKRNNKPIKIIKERKDILTVLLDYLNTKDMKDILILGRNNNDIKQYTDIVTDCNGYIKYNNMNVRYLTVHKSKGLEEENIILINLYDCVTGFPNKIKDDEILNELKPNIKSYLYDEERRLFYVALTRTKNNVFLIVPNKKSVFVEEIQRENGKYIEYLSI